MKRPSKKVQVPKSVDLTPEEMSAYGFDSSAIYSIECPNGDPLSCPSDHTQVEAYRDKATNKIIGVVCQKNYVQKIVYCPGYSDSGTGDSGSSGSGGDSGTADNYVDACSGKELHDKCSFIGKTGIFHTGICSRSWDNKLYCNDELGYDIIDDDIWACNGKTAGSKCSWTGTSGASHSGRCVMSPSHTLYCDDKSEPSPTPHLL